MKAYIGYCIAGVLAFDENGRLIDKEFFDKSAKRISDNLGAIKSGFIGEEKRLFKSLGKRGFTAFYGAYPKSGDVTIEPDAEGRGENCAKSAFREIALKERWIESQAELNRLLAAVGAESSKTELRNTNKDKIGMRVVGMMDELDKNMNTLSEHMREWYGLYFPEANGLLRDNEKFAEFIATKTSRDNFERNGKRLDIVSAGMNFDESDLESAKGAASVLMSMYKERKNLEIYLDRLGKQIIPNTSAVAGSFLAFKLIAQAGGLDKIAKLPSSTIQLLGAEKALFRFLKKKGKAPKHGIIFYHPAVISAPIPLRGKVARIVASKITLAARVDLYSGRDMSEQMKKELDDLVLRALSHSNKRR